MIKELRNFESENPEIVFYWKDKKTEAEGWLVINSLKNGAAGGGTRMRKGLNLDEVISLAKTMEIKFTISGPNIGGAKSGINFDPNDSRKKEVLERWFNACVPLLKNYYGTGGDLNVDEVREILPITSQLGLLHPQEGIVKGHFKAKKEKRARIIKQLQYWIKKELDDDFLKKNKINISDMITGYGVATSILNYYKIWGSDLKNKRVIIQGFGNVGGATAYYLSKFGASIVGLTDHEGGILIEKGLNFQEIKELFINRKNNLIKHEKKLPKTEIDKIFWNTKVDVFVPAAGSRLINKEKIDRLLENGLELISCGANVPFDDKEIFFGETSLYVDNKISVIPDFIANCGIARLFAFLMEERENIDDEIIFQDVSNTIEKALLEIHNINKSKIKISQIAMEIALKKIRN
ncbi:MAG: amino acid dehydrogenase [Candidatus Sericytochromatia bacterium]|nr:MAG: amino acid dehydrogenase [Candidatus Sericytochromatia bacterium]